MIWEYNNPLPKVGDFRSIVKFAWLPVKFVYQGKPHKLWLERYSVEEEFKHLTNGEENIFTWVEVAGTRSRCYYI